MSTEEQIEERYNCTILAMNWEDGTALVAKFDHKGGNVTRVVPIPGAPKR